MKLKPFEWKDRPALIEYLFPVQKLSVESFKEQMAGKNKTLTALGSFWKGRKPLILNKACILGSLLPVSDNLKRDLEIFEMLMGMDRETLEKRLTYKSTKQADLFKTQEREEKYHIKYRDYVREACRPEECGDGLFSHIWSDVNKHFGTDAFSFPELVEEIGIARFGHRPRVSDVFSGSGQIPFEAARLGCDVYSSDINPIACLLTWGAFNVVGALPQERANFESKQKALAENVKNKIDLFNIETDGNGWELKALLYCAEVRCPESGWMVPLLPTRIVSKGNLLIVKLVPDIIKKNYKIELERVGTPEELEFAKIGTLQDGVVVHSPDGVNEYRIKISTIRGDYFDSKLNKNHLRLWEKEDIVPHKDDIFQERLYVTQWMRKKINGKGEEFEFRTVSEKDIEREEKIINYVKENLLDWQNNGWVPDMQIEKGEETERLYRERGWTHWHHLFNARQLFYLSILRSNLHDAFGYVRFMDLLNYSSRLCPWATSPKRVAKDGSGKNIGGASDNPANVFYNQALNTLYAYGCRALNQLLDVFLKKVANSPIKSVCEVNTLPANSINIENDIYITDPPYGDAVKYEEITEFFIAWLRKNPPPEFAHWTWDSRRALAIKGEDEGFRQGMIVAYRKMGQMMPDNGIQVLMFTHKSGTIWADMANIVWAAGLQVTAAWYVVTETDSALRQGANVTGTIMLVLRKRTTRKESFRDELGWEIEAAVKQQVESLTGLDKTVRQDNAEGLYNDADIQMAGYAAALKVLTTYAVIDGKEMDIEATAPRKKGVKSFVDELIDFAVQTAVQFLVPIGFEKEQWQKLAPIERYYLKMVDMEAQGEKTLDNYLNFAKAFRVRNSDSLMASSKANSARLLTAGELKGELMSGNAEISSTSLRAILYAMYEIQKDIETNDVLLHLMENCGPNYLQTRSLLITVATFLAAKRDYRGTLHVPKNLESIYEAESSSARVLAEAIRNQRL